jgi:acetylornithine deacetylase
MPLSEKDAVELTRALTRIDSRNPDLVPGGPGEGSVAEYLASVLRQWGFAVELYQVRPGRPNVIARIGRPGGRSILLNGHLDVVGVDGMRHAPFAAESRNGRIYGRGSADMKGGIAAMCVAAAMTGRDASIEIIIAAVIDEEYGSLGTIDLLERGIRADAAIITEPTRLAIMPAHRGFAWTEVTVHGRAAHGSRWEIGVDAIRHAGLLLAELDSLEHDVLPRREHALLGRGSLHASLIEGGTGMSTYPDRCVLKIERRTLPGESGDDARAEVEAACERVRARRPSFQADVRLMLSQPPSDVAVSAPVVRALENALLDNGEAIRIEGMSAWTDAALFNAAGIPAICFGPGDIALAHAAEEWIEEDEIARATRVLAGFLSGWSSRDLVLNS